MKIIGLNNEMYISSACLIEDGKILSAVAEERLTREKLTRKFPEKAIRYCLENEKIQMNEVDYIAASWNPGVYFQKFNPNYSGQRRHLVEQMYSIPDNLMKFNKGAQVDYIYQELIGNMGKIRIFFITHHRAHAANGFFLSPFETAAILTADGQGEFESATFCHGRDNKIKLLKGINYPISLGALYSTFTEYLGFKANSDEWKVMAMASYAHWDNKYYKLMKNELTRLLPDGGFELDLNYFKGFIHEQPNLYSEKMFEKFGKPRKKDDEMKDCHFEIAAALQKITEDISSHMLIWLFKQTKEKNLALSGGSFLNSVFNGKALELSPFENIYISSCPDDSGNCFGAALYLYNNILDNKRGEPMTHNYYGPEYSDEDIENALKAFGLKYKREEKIEEIVANVLSKGKIVGWFQGKMEFGQRALGNRSILADPRRAEMKDKVNGAVKFRESFRPFAPAVIKEKQHEYFEIGKCGDVPFMEKVYIIKSDKRKLIPAVTHVDGTGRIQTVTMESNLKFFNLIKEFEKITGIPIVLNTSFNLNGEPIVCDPQDAIRTFFSCGLDILALGNYLIHKNG